MLIGLLAANAALTVLYAAVRRLRREECGVVFFFLFLPGLGFVLYYLPGLLRVFFEKVGIDREAVLIRAFEVELQPDHPDVREALNLAPVEDAMAVSGNMEKRALLLRQLKKDLRENYRVLLAAEQDEDPESAHYAVVAKREIYRIQQTRWLECRRDLEQDPNDPERYHTACTVLGEMLESGILSGREQNAYYKRLCDLVQRQLKAGESTEASEDVVSPKEYEAYLNALVELGRYAQAESLWQKYKNRMQNSETAWQTMMKMFYRTGERQKFEALLDELRQNRQLRLSPKGLEQLRYWTNRLGAAAQG